MTKLASDLVTSTRDPSAASAAVHSTFSQLGQSRGHSHYCSDQSTESRVQWRECREESTETRVQMVRMCLALWSRQLGQQLLIRVAPAALRLRCDF